MVSVPMIEVSTKEMPNIHGIPDDELKEALNVRKGAFVIVLKSTLLCDERIPLLRILELAKHRTVIVVERDPDLNFRVIRSSPNYPTQGIQLNLRAFRDEEKFVITAVWSESGVFLHINNKPGKPFNASHVNFREGADGVIYEIVGTESVRIAHYLLVKDTTIVLEPGAKESFDYQIQKAQGFVKTCDIVEPFVRKSLVEQIIPMLVTGFESYMRTRFAELEEEGIQTNLDALEKKLFPKRIDKFKAVRAQGAKEGKGILRLLLDRRMINFQEWRKCARAYKAAYGIDINELGINPRALTRLQRAIQWRHPISHKSGDHTILNIDQISQQKPIIATKKLAIETLKAFTEFVETFHQYTVTHQP